MAVDNKQKINTSVEERVDNKEKNQDAAAAVGLEGS